MIGLIRSHDRPTFSLVLDFFFLSFFYLEFSTLLSRVTVPVHNVISSELRVPLYLYLHQHLLSAVFLILAILTGVRCNRKVVLIAKDVEHF